MEVYDRDGNLERFHQWAEYYGIPFNEEWCDYFTAFSASEAAEGLNYLALAGYSADEAATALPYTLKLAGAGAMELGAASDMVTDAMAALNLEANETNLSTFSDQLAKTATKTNTSVSQLGEAILTVGGTAANLAGGTSELNAALGILANVGIKGSEGGTKLRNMITSLQSPTDKAASAMKDLGLQVYDQQGNMRSLNDIFSDMNTAMAGMTNAEKRLVLYGVATILYQMYQYINLNFNKPPQRFKSS